MAEGDNSYFRSLHSWWREGHKRHKNMYLANGPIYMLHTTRLVCTMQTWCHYIWSSEIPSVITVALLAYYSSQRQPVAHILECEKLEVPPADFFFFFHNEWCILRMSTVWDIFIVVNQGCVNYFFELEAYLEALVVTFDVARAVCFIIQSASTLE